MDKYRLVEEKVIGAAGFDRGSANASSIDDTCIVRITPQAKPRSCITTAMTILVRNADEVCSVATGVNCSL